MSFDIYVGNYPFEYNRDDMVSLFKDFERTKLHKWFKKERKSYCFFTCEDMEQVVSVIQKMNNAPVSGRKLIVRAADESLQEYVNLILLGKKCDSETLNKKEFTGHDTKILNKKETRWRDLETLNGKESKFSNSKNLNGKESKWRDSETSNGKEPRECDLKTLNEKQFKKAEENTETTSQICEDSLPFVPLQVLKNRSAEKASQSSYNNKAETSHPKCLSLSSIRESIENPSHERISNDLFSKQDDDDDDDLSECVWLSVTNFPFRTPIRWIYELFDDYAPLKVLMLCNEPRRDRMLTEAHVCFYNREVADDVIMNFDNTMFNGRILLVNDIEDLTLMKELVNVVN